MSPKSPKDKYTGPVSDFSEATEHVVDEIFTYMSSLLDATLQDAKEALKADGYDRENAVKHMARLAQASQEVSDFVTAGINFVLNKDAKLMEVAARECAAVSGVFDRNVERIKDTAEYIGHDGAGNEEDKRLN